MADPQKKLEKLVSEAVSARVEEMQKSLVEEMTASLAPILATAEERAEAAEEHVDSLEKELKEATKRAERAEKELQETQEKLEKAKAKKSAPEYPPGGAPTDLLSAAAATIADAGGQADILKATLDGIAQFAARTALYVVKGGQLAGWQGRGFEGEIKGTSVNASAGLAARAMEDKEPVSAAAAEFDKGFIDTHGNPGDGNATVLPLVVRDKVSAIIYVDGGAEAKADLSAARVLVRTAAMWLEILALRKLAGGTAEAEAPAAVASVAAAEAPAEAVPEPVKAAAAAAPVSSAPAPTIAAGDEETHKKAKRFAKLLVDEIKLYNQKKVDEGKKSRDLYSRLKEDIDKSRQTYEKRWGSSPAGPANYFHAELVRILADGDESLLGM